MFAKAANGKLVDEKFVEDIKKVHRLILDNEEIGKYSYLVIMEACMSIITQFAVYNKLSLEKTQTAIKVLYEYYSKQNIGNN